MTPVTQMLAAFALSAVIVLALWQSTSGGSSVGSFVAFISAMLMLVAPIKHLSDVMAPITRGLAAVERGIDLVEQSPQEKPWSGPRAPASRHWCTCCRVSWSRPRAASCSTACRWRSGT